MMQAYEEAFNRYKNLRRDKDGATYTKDTDETAKAYAEMINKIIFFNGCIVELIGNWLWISGNTREYSKELKELKFIYSGNKKSWHFHKEPYTKRNKITYSLDDIRKMHGSIEYENEQKRIAAA